ncbi:hypothetical protein BC834DRAFT_972451 [Gloeopeniophorella convolvens]|nr:hypothetical protein BC834DRAFT_972451 [Gloeopeniophorella convolvens]
MTQFEDDAFLDIPEDDDMPPLVDAPPPAMTMMTYSLNTDFTTIVYSPDPPAFDVAPEPVQRFEIISEDDVPRISAVKPSHAKKRDAGHIPRPPNAFILFRSSFIKSERVPGNIEGNHSTLSKIIGIVWKTLPPEEREQWEKRAVQAQAEHRARYPDWRFRPGMNVDAIVKRKLKDKNKDQPSTRRRRGAGAHDKVTSSAGDRCKARSTRGHMQEQRCAQIAELLSQGIKGVALTSAVQAWDKESGVSPATDGVFVAEPGIINAKAPFAPHSEDNKDSKISEAIKARSASPTQDARFNVPLTSMFRRGLSVPPTSEDAAAQCVAWVPHYGPEATSGAALDLYPPPLSPASSVSYDSEVSFPETENANTPCMFDVASLSPPGSPFSPDSDASSLGPITPNSITSLSTPTHDDFRDDFRPSSYSTLRGWAGSDNNKIFSYGNGMENPFSFVPMPYSAADPWGIPGLIDRPFSLEDAWAGARATSAPYV